MNQSRASSMYPPVLGTSFLVAALMIALAADPARAATEVHAQTDTNVGAMLGVDPADVSSSLMPSASVVPSQTLTRTLGARTTIFQTTSMAEVMRASRTIQNEIIFAPAHVTASAILHAYQLLATSGTDQTYVLVVRNSIDSIAMLPGKRLYLPQQDSLRSYVAKGLLTESGVKLRQFSNVTYGNTSGAGLVALAFNMADVTVADEAQAREWIAANPKIGHVLKSTRPVPGGINMVVRKDFCATECGRLAAWVKSADGQIPGIGRFQLASADAGKQFTYVASLGIATPDSIKGATSVTAEQVAELMQQGAVIVDTRSKNEYDTEHIRGAVLASYLEKSLKDIDFDSSRDDFTALKAVLKDKPTVFLCNGPECWKSYKASRQALAAGFTKVYWFRGGMPEWREKRLPVEGSAGSATAKMPGPASKDRA